jgi:hypothetical protein
VPDSDDEASLKERRFAPVDRKNGDFKSPLLERGFLGRDLNTTLQKLWPKAKKWN